MRLGCFVALATLVATPVLAQPFYGYGSGYGYGPSPAARHEWHEARRAEEVAQQRAAMGDYAGAARAHNFAQWKRFEAHQLRQQGY